jgi:dienelactone hydrolase
MKRLLSLLIIGFMSGSAVAAVVGHEVDYKAGDTNLKGYIAWDDSIKGKRPGVLVVHEWWGYNEYARKRARMLAELGYTAFALDMYGNGKQVNHPDEASKFSSEVMKNMPVAEARFKAAMKVLQNDKTVDPTRIAAIGYCFGGGVVLQMMRLDLDLKGVASFHGFLGTDIKLKPGTIKTKVLVLNGEDDPFTKPEQIAGFKKEMEEAKIDYRFINYPGAKHAFTNPDATRLGNEFNLPLAYNEAADKASWRELETFLKEIFKK